MKSVIGSQARPLEGEFDGEGELGIVIEIPPYQRDEIGAGKEGRGFFVGELRDGGGVQRREVGRIVRSILRVGAEADFLVVGKVVVIGIGGHWVGAEGVDLFAIAETIVVAIENEGAGADVVVLFGIVEVISIRIGEEGGRAGRKFLGVRE